MVDVNRAQRRAAAHRGPAPGGGTSVYPAWVVVGHLVDAGGADCAGVVCVGVGEEEQPPAAAVEMCAHEALALADELRRVAECILAEQP